jgi:hypothetical protein
LSVSNLQYPGVLRQGLAMLDPLGDDAQRQRRRLGARFDIGRAVDQNAGQGGHFRQPTAVVFAFGFNAEQQ